MTDAHRSSDQLVKCWLCEKEFSGPGYPTIFGMQCPECGPPQPWGPIEKELRYSEEWDSEDA